MELSTLGLLVQTIGAFLLAAILLYLGRGGGNRVLKAAGWAYACLFASLLALFISLDTQWSLGNAPYLYLKILYLACLVVAAQRMEHDVPLGKPLLRVAIGALPIAFLVTIFAKGSLFYAIHMSLLAVGWGLITILIFMSRGSGLGKQFSGLLALLTALVQLAYVVFFAVSASQSDRSFAFLAYTGFYDLFLEMLFGIGLIIWGM